MKPGNSSEVNRNRSNSSDSLFRILRELEKISKSRAIIKAKEFLKKQPRNVKLLHYIATRLKWSGNLPAAVEYFKKALEINPKRLNTLKGLAHTYFLQEELGEAEKVYRKIIQLGKADTDTYCHLADLLIQRGGRHQNAFALIQMAIEPQGTDPHNIFALLTKAKIMLHMEKTPEECVAAILADILVALKANYYSGKSIEKLKDGLDLLKATPDLHSSLKDLLEYRTNLSHEQLALSFEVLLKKCFKEYQQSHVQPQEQPKSVDPIELRRKLNELNNRLRVERDNPALLSLMGECLAQLGQHDRAEEFYARAIALLNPSEPIQLKDRPSPEQVITSLLAVINNTNARRFVHKLTRDLEDLEHCAPEEIAKAQSKQELQTILAFLSKSPKGLRRKIKQIDEEKIEAAKQKLVAALKQT